MNTDHTVEQSLTIYLLSTIGVEIVSLIKRLDYYMHCKEMKETDDIDIKQLPESNIKDIELMNSHISHEEVIIFFLFLIINCLASPKNSFKQSKPNFHFIQLRISFSPRFKS